MPYASLKEITPQPEGVHFPFYYASIQCLWVFWEVPVEAAEKALARAADFDAGLGVTRLRGAGAGAGAGCGDGETAGALLNFQRYTGHLPNALATTNEVEFNILCTPKSAATTPAMTLGEYMRGGDQTGTIGQLRLHVAADNIFAVKAGRDGFGENKFHTLFDYVAPTLNDPAVVASPPSYPAKWRTALYRPDQFHEIEIPVDEYMDRVSAPKEEEKADHLYDLTADLDGLPTSPVAATPITEFALGLGRTVVTRWTMLGTFAARVFEAGEAERVALSIGPEQPDPKSCFAAMREDLELLLAGRPAYGVQTYDTPPGCIEPPGWFLDA